MRFKKGFFKLKKTNFTAKKIKQDIQYGIVKRFIKFLPFFFFCLAVSILFYQNAVQLTESVPTFTDHLLYLFKGMPVRQTESHEPFKVPYIWLFFNLYIAYLIGNYPQNELKGIGTSLLLRLQSRKIWWLSKCVWNVLTVSICYFLIFLSVFSICLFTGGLSLSATPQIQQIFSQIQLSHASEHALLLYVIFLPILTSIAVSLFQMSFSFIVSPLFSYVCIITMYILSAYYAKLPFGNFSMLLRSRLFYAQGYGLSTALLFDGGLIILSVIIGFWRFKKYNILNKSDGVKDD